ncbi:MAG TPA: type II toxin-antitoxin system VapC family toxin [Pseudolabrys sp.]|nr:type II toxin-antitoxin system VapC family toxin [Pseudolabrys sp.]
MTTVVDASVAAQWVLNEPSSGRALALRDETALIAPSLIASEIGSALWKAVRRGAVQSADAIAAINNILIPFDALIPIEDLRSRALEFAIELNHPIYDCFYLALAERERCPLVTADKRLMAAAKKIKRIEVRAL